MDIIDISDLLTAKSIFTREQKMQLNDVLVVVITGAMIGKISVWELEKNEEYFLGGDIVKFQCLDNVNPQFIFAWLRCQNSQIEIKKNVTGATNGHLSPSDIGNILIPLPPPEKQTEIANHISVLRTQAKQLQQQAAAELAHAKQHVEQLILGRSNLGLCVTTARLIRAHPTIYPCVWLIRGRRFSIVGRIRTRGILLMPSGTVHVLE